MVEKPDRTHLPESIGECIVVVVAGVHRQELPPQILGTEAEIAGNLFATCRGNAGIQTADERVKTCSPGIVVVISRNSKNGIDPFRIELTVVPI